MSSLTGNISTGSSTGLSGTIIGSAPPSIPFVVHFTVINRDGTQRTGVRVVHNSNEAAAIEDFWSTGLATKNQHQRGAADVQEIRIHKVDRADLEGDMGLPAVPTEKFAMTA